MGNYVFEVFGWAEAAPGAAAQNLAGGLLDQIYNVTGDNIRTKKGINNLVGCWYGAESTAGYVNIRQPGLKIDHQFIHATDINDFDAKKGLSWLGPRPLPLKGGEWTSCIETNASDEDAICGLFVSSSRSMFDQNVLNAVNPTHSLRGTADQAATANTWTNCTMTWDQALEVGLYYPVGMKCAGYKASAPGSGLARLITQNGAQYRPGVVMELSEGDKVQLDSGNGDMGCNVWPLMDAISFDESNLPNIEVLTNMANTDYVVELLLVQEGFQL